MQLNNNALRGRTSFDVLENSSLRTEQTEEEEGVNSKEKQTSNMG